MAVPEFLHPYCRVARDDFISVVRGQGALIWDSNGKEYVDGLASLWCVNVGHGRQEITDAVTAQMREIAVYHCFEPFTNEPADQITHEIAEVAPLDGCRVFLTSSGSEAVDSSMKIARVAHEQRGEGQRDIIISRSRAYHGVTYGGLSVQGLPGNQEGYGPFVGGVVNLPADDIEAVASVFAEQGDRIAAVLTEPVQGAGGVWPPPEGYLEGLRRLCDQHGAYLIFDEVITGYGRLGEWFGASYFGVTPDLITFAKGVTSGYLPLGGVVVSKNVADALASDPTWVLKHGHTYSGHPSACAAGLANLKILRDENLAARAPVIGERLGAGLRSLLDDGLVKDARGVGAVWGVGLHEQHDAGDLRNQMLERGVVSRAIGTETIAFCPPLVINDEQIDTLVDALADVLR